MVTSANNQQQEIKQILQTEVECVRLLLKSLELEYEALAGHHSAALEEVVRDKQERMQQLEVISRRREKLLASFDGVNTDVNADENQQNKHYLFNDDKLLTELWSELVNVAEECREKNRVNGSVVELVSRQSRHALDILRGIAPDSLAVSELYDNAGHTKSFSNKRSLVHI
jgi:flagellar biosynthesis/type III secretory pathway chaperone